MESKEKQNEEAGDCQLELSLPRLHSDVLCFLRPQTEAGRVRLSRVYSKCMISTSDFLASQRTSSQLTPFPSPSLSTLS